MMVNISVISGIGVKKTRVGSVLRLGAVTIGILACLATSCGTDDETNEQTEGATPYSDTGSGGAEQGTSTTNETGGSNSSTAGTGGIGTVTTGGTKAPVAGASSQAGSSAAGNTGVAGNGTEGEQAGDAGNASDASDVGDAGEAGSTEPETCDQIPPSSADCAAPLAPGDDRKCSIGVGMAQRSYYMYAPPTYNPCKPTALVVDCHGASETAEQQAGLDDQFMGDLYPGKGSGWRLEADTENGGFIVLTPQGINNVWNEANNDPQFMLDIIAHTKTVANIADDKVYMTGISNGSAITYQTVCPNTEVFAGISPHSAGVSCGSIEKPIPVISFDAAPDFAYQSTVNASENMVNLDKCTGPENANWLTIDSNYDEPVCRNDPYDTNPTLVPCSSITETSLGPIKPTVCKRMDGCEDGVSVVFCEVAPSTRNGPMSAATDAHIIYGNATSLNTPSVAWRFFKEFWK